MEALSPATFAILLTVSALHARCLVVDSIAPTDQVFATASDDASIRIFDLEGHRGTPLRELKGVRQCHRTYLLFWLRAFLVSRFFKVPGRLALWRQGRGQATVVFSKPPYPLPLKSAPRMVSNSLCMCVCVCVLFYM